jgi:hypothetical protein
MPVSVLLSLHVGVFVFIAAVLLPWEASVFVAGVRVELVLSLFAVLYLFLAFASVVPSYRWKFGLALSAVSVPFFGILFAILLGFTGGLPRTGWFIGLSLVDSLGFLLLLLLVHYTARSPPRAA